MWKRIDHLKATGFTPDELNWLLAADRSAKAAVKETDAARFLAALRKELQAIQAEYDPAQYDFLTAMPPTDVDGLTALLTSLLQKLNRDEAADAVFHRHLAGRGEPETDGRQACLHRLRLSRAAITRLLITPSAIDRSR